MEEYTKEKAEEQLIKIIDQLALTKVERDHLYRCVETLKSVDRKILQKNEKL